MFFYVFKVTSSLLKHESPPGQKQTQRQAAHSSSSLCIHGILGYKQGQALPFGGSSALSFRNPGAGTEPPNLHEASESLFCLLNTDTSPQTHTSCLPCQPSLSTEDSLCLDWITNGLFSLFFCSFSLFLPSPLYLNTAYNLIRVGLFSFDGYHTHALL